MKYIVYVCALLLIASCAPREPVYYCDAYKAEIERYQPCIDIAPACSLKSREARWLKEAKEHKEKYCKNEAYYG